MEGVVTHVLARKSFPHGHAGFKAVGCRSGCNDCARMLRVTCSSRSLSMTIDWYRDFLCGKNAATNVLNRLPRIVPGTIGGCLTR